MITDEVKFMLHQMTYLNDLLLRPLSVESRQFLLMTLITSLFLAPSCTDSPPVDNGVLSVPPMGPEGVPTRCLQQVVCQGSLARYCVGSEDEIAIDCVSTGGMCIAGTGCTICTPNELSCDGLQIMSCSADGQTNTPTTTCDTACYNGACTDPCARAVAERSYQGCEYWPTPLSNTVASQFNFAIGVVNVNAEAVNISIRRGQQSIDQRVISPGQLEVIVLPWIEALSYEGTIDQSPAPIQGSTRVMQGAYQVIADLPVSMYQFNPLEYRQDGNCAVDDQDPSDNACYSYSNDASLLLPTHALDKDYIVLSYPSLGIAFPQAGATLTNPSSFQVIAVSPEITEVEITFSASTAASHQGTMQAYQAGQSATFSLSQGEVLQFAAAPITRCNNPTAIDQESQHCEVGSEGDLSGSLVSASKPVEVFGSHTCAFIPYNVFACDHLEESIFPLSAWGSQAVVTKIQPLLDEPSIVRVTSGADGNSISFDPPNTHPSVTLSQGEMVQFESRRGFVVSGNKGLQVSQFLVGQNYSAGSSRDGFGDPAFSLIPPSDQFRTDYTILAPQTYAIHFLNLTMRQGANITLDGQPLNEGDPIGDSPWRELTMEIDGGVHTLEGETPFGVWVYGFGNYTSYMYPGGLDLNVINDVQ